MEEEQEQVVLIIEDIPVKEGEGEGEGEKALLPMVSLCTPTFNRRPFIQAMIQCIERQTYPKDRMEWIIVDDGTDPIEDLVKDHPLVKYFYSPERMVLGKKRNWMHSKCSGDIFVYIDDDDYYPPERVQHAVEMLQQNPAFQLAGSSKMYCYFDSQKAIYQCGPYKPTHATAATFAFRKELLLETRYDEHSALAEENKFTKGYTIPMIQLDAMKTILVFSHSHNSLDKEKLLVNPAQTKTVRTTLAIKDFHLSPELEQFYVQDIHGLLLKNYEPGLPIHKPEMARQLKQAEESRERRLEEFKKQHMEQAKAQAQAQNNSSASSLSPVEILEKKLAEKDRLIQDLFKRIKELTLNQKPPKE